MFIYQRDKKVGSLEAFGMISNSGKRILLLHDFFTCREHAYKFAKVW